MKLHYLSSCLSVLVVLIMSGCLGGDESSIPDKSIKTYLGGYEISFNLTSKYDYDLDLPNRLDKVHEYSSGSYYCPSYLSETRTIEDETNSMYRFDVSVIKYDLPQAQTMEALDKWLWLAKKGTSTWTTYDQDIDFQHTYRVMDKGPFIKAACWLDGKTMLTIHASGWDIPYDRKDFNFTNVLKSLRTTKFPA